jgi:hypothetical protein
LPLSGRSGFSRKEEAAAADPPAACWEEEEDLKSTVIVLGDRSSGSAVELKSDAITAAVEEVAAKEKKAANMS